MTAGSPPDLGLDQVLCPDVPTGLRLALDEIARGTPEQPVAAILHAVTGSGKNEAVYAEVAGGRRVAVFQPNQALAGQSMARAGQVCPAHGVGRLVGAGHGDAALERLSVRGWPAARIGRLLRRSARTQIIGDPDPGLMCCTHAALALARSATIRPHLAGRAWIVDEDLGNHVETFALPELERAREWGAWGRRHDRIWGLANDLLFAAGKGLAHRARRQAAEARDAGVPTWRAALTFGTWSRADELAEVAQLLAELRAELESIPMSSAPPPTTRASVDRAPIRGILRYLAATVGLDPGRPEYLVGPTGLELDGGVDPATVEVHDPWRLARALARQSFVQLTATPDAAGLRLRLPYHRLVVFKVEARRPDLWWTHVLTRGARTDRAGLAKPGVAAQVLRHAADRAGRAPILVAPKAVAALVRDGALPWPCPNRVVHYGAEAGQNIAQGADGIALLTDSAASNRGAHERVAASCGDDPQRYHRATTQRAHQQSVGRLVGRVEGPARVVTSGANVPVIWPDQTPGEVVLVDITPEGAPARTATQGPPPWACATARESARPSRPDPYRALYRDQDERVPGSTSLHRPQAAQLNKALADVGITPPTGLSDVQVRDNVCGQEGSFSARIRADGTFARYSTAPGKHACPCSSCAHKVADKQRGQLGKLLDPLERLAGGEVAVIPGVMTIGQFGRAVGLDDAPAIRRLVAQSLDAALREVAGLHHTDRIAARVRLHPAGDTAPRRWRPHWHILLADAVYGTVTGEVRPLGVDPAALCETWARRFTAAFRAWLRRKHGDTVADALPDGYITGWVDLPRTGPDGACTAAVEGRPFPHWAPSLPAGQTGWCGIGVWSSRGVGVLRRLADQVDTPARDTADDSSAAPSSDPSDPSEPASLALYQLAREDADRAQRLVDHDLHVRRGGEHGAFSSGALARALRETRGTSPIRTHDTVSGADLWCALLRATQPGAARWPARPPWYRALPSATVLEREIRSQLSAAGTPPPAGLAWVRLCTDPWAAAGTTAYLREVGARLVGVHNGELVVAVAPDRAEAVAIDLGARVAGVHARLYTNAEPTMPHVSVAPPGGSYEPVPDTVRAQIVCRYGRLRAPPRPRPVPSPPKARRTRAP